MIEEKTVPAMEAHSKGGIIKATLLALGVAAVILVVAILPAEYGIDPLGTGKAMGLTGISQTSETATSGRATPAQAGIFRPENKVYKVDSEDMSLRPGEGVEVKYHMQQGAAMVYSWKADGKLQYEFHGEPDQKPKPGYFESYKLDDKVGITEMHGSFIAPTTGIHGWFWANKTDKPVVFHLVTAGFYDSARMYAGDPKGDEMPIEDAK